MLEAVAWNGWLYSVECVKVQRLAARDGVGSMWVVGWVNRTQQEITCVREREQRKCVSLP